MLLPGSNSENCYFEGDNEEQTFHLGAFVEGKLVSIASFYFIRNPSIEDPYQFCLKGMATLDEYQNMGFSSELLKMAFPIIKQNFCTLLWCNARETAQGYYEKVGFTKKGELSEDHEFGKQVLMIKKITH